MSTRSSAADLASIINLASEDPTTIQYGKSARTLACVILALLSRLDQKQIDGDVYFGHTMEHITHFICPWVAGPLGTDYIDELVKCLEGLAATCDMFECLACYHFEISQTEDKPSTINVKLTQRDEVWQTMNDELGLSAAQA